MRYRIGVILVFFSLNLPAQHPGKYIFRHIDQADGLLHNDVYSVSQDAKGYIWILTANGLQRYDGTRFINYPRIVSDGKIELGDLYADNKQNELWVSKGEVLEKLDLSNNRFRKYDAEQVVKDPAFTFDTYTDEYNKRYLLGEKGLFL